MPPLSSRLSVVYFNQRTHACACVCMVQNDQKLFLSFSNMRRHAQACVCWSKYTTDILTLSSVLGICWFTRLFQISKLFSFPGKLLATAFIAPSLTPIVAGTARTNPGVRIYSYQTGQSSFLDYDQVK